MFVTNWNSTTKIQKISEITNFFRHYFLSRTEVLSLVSCYFSFAKVFTSIPNIFRIGALIICFKRNINESDCQL